MTNWFAIAALFIINAVIILSIVFIALVISVIVYCVTMFLKIFGINIG